jgi:hypothetical protein
MTESLADRRMYRFEWAVFVLMCLLMTSWGVYTEIRSCFISRRMTDFDVYLRAAWAARTGQDMYAVTDDNGWHYCYPPPFALFLMPFADPAVGSPRDGYLPYPGPVALWILLSYGLAFWTVHALARAIVPDAKPYSRRWWFARTGPLFLSIGPLLHTIIHGQVNMLVGALIAAAFLAWAAQRRLASGAWLASAIALKMTPAFLVLFPLLRRDSRSIAGIGLGLALLLVALPACVFGVTGAVQENQKFVAQVIEPGLTGKGDQTRALELTQTKNTDSQSFQFVIHNALHPDWNTRPANASTEVRLVHWAIVGVMTLTTLLVGWRNRHGDAATQLLVLGCLLLVMVLASPVSHIHHYGMALPAISGLWLIGVVNRRDQAWPPFWTSVVLFVWFLGIAVPSFEGRFFAQMREFGVSTAATVITWLAGVIILARQGRQTTGGHDMAGQVGPNADGAQPEPDSVAA